MDQVRAVLIHPCCGFVGEMPGIMAACKIQYFKVARRVTVKSEVCLGVRTFFTKEQGSR